MISHARRGIAALAALAAVVTACVACAAVQPPGPAPANPRPASAHASQPPGSLTALLPVSPALLQAAAALAAQFAEAYDTHRPGEPASAWLARLAPMATSQLTGALTRAAAPPGSADADPAQTGQAVAEQIRDLTPASVIFIVQVRLAIPGAADQYAGSDALAVTVTRQDGGGWAVYDIEPAAAGNTGGAAGATGGQ